MVEFTLWMVRHGQTAYNKKSIIQGHLDVPLSQVGIEQAKMVGMCLCRQHFTRVYSSDLLRARQTAEEIMRLNMSFNGVIVNDNRLRERKFGDCEGKTVADLKKLLATSRKNLIDYCPPGGETLKQMSNRAVSFFGDLCKTMCAESESCRSIINKTEREADFHNSELSEELISTVESLRSNSSPRKSNAKENQEAEIRFSGLESARNPNNSGSESTAVEISSSSQVNCGPEHSCESERKRPISDDTFPAPSHVLLVSHGGLIKELLHHLFKDLHCEYRGKKEQAFRIPPNASISKFHVSVKSKRDCPTVSCLQLHCAQHLSSTEHTNPAAKIPTEEMAF